jgi:cysteine-rich repeat protein
MFRIMLFLSWLVVVSLPGCRGEDRDGPGDGPPADCADGYECPRDLIGCTIRPPDRPECIEACSRVYCCEYTEGLGWKETILDCERYGDDAGVDAPVPVCGDGVVITPESCDDGDRVYGGNGCLDDCTYSQGLVCAVSESDEPGTFAHLGVPEVAAGVIAMEFPFLLAGVSSEEINLDKPKAGTYVVLPFVTNYDPNDQDCSWQMTVTESSLMLAIRVSTSGTCSGSVTSGKLMMLGFDNDFSGYLPGRASGYQGGESVELVSTGMRARTKVLPVAYMSEYRDQVESASWEISTDLTPSCTATYSGNGTITWRASTLLLSEAIRIKQQEFDLSGTTNTWSASFVTTPSAQQLWIPLVEKYDDGGADSVGYTVNCSTNIGTIDCQAAIFDGDSTSRVAGRVILLESLGGFGPGAMGNSDAAGSTVPSRLPGVWPRR